MQLDTTKIRYNFVCESGFGMNTLGLQYFEKPKIIQHNIDHNIFDFFKLQSKSITSLLFGELSYTDYLFDF